MQGIPKLTLLAIAVETVPSSSQPTHYVQDSETSPTDLDMSYDLFMQQEIQFSSP